MKLQDIFDECTVHLMGMDGPSLDQHGDACVYRGKDEDCEFIFNGQKCAVGLFIADEQYDVDLEGQGISGGQAVADAVAASWGQDDLTVAQIGLLADLQDAHDRRRARGRVWSNYIIASLDRIATKHHLRFDPVTAAAD